MKKADTLKSLLKGAKNAKLKSKLLAVASGIIAGLMYKAGVEYGAYATAAQVTSLIPDETEKESNEDTN